MFLFVILDMQKLFTYISLSIFLFCSSCHSGKNTNEFSTNVTQENKSIFPVTDFLKGQLRLTDSMQSTPLKITVSNGKADSIWLKREDVRSGAVPFLTPIIDSATMSSFVSEKSFLDQTINAFTFSYDPKVKMPDSIKLIHWDVYVNPESGTVQRVYLVKETAENDTNIITQLTWVTDKWYSIRTITQLPEKEPEIKEEKMIWDFE